MPLADKVVVGVMCRCDLHRTGPKFGFDIFIGNDRDLAAVKAAVHTVVPIKSLYRSSDGLTATAVSPSIVSGRVVATVIVGRFL